MTSTEKEKREKDNSTHKKTIEPSKDEAQTALFNDPVRTAQ
jgi:hypothetical protein